MIRDITAQLYSRSMHRMFGNPTIGTLAGFLTIIFVIRSSVNLYFFYIISSGNVADIAYNQITAGWFLYLAAYFIFCSSLSAFHVGFAIPKGCFIFNSSNGKRFRSTFMRQAALIRPVNIVVLILAVTGCFILRNNGGGLFAGICGPVVIAVSFVLAFLLFRIAEKLSVGMVEIQVIETVLLGILVMLNPDVIKHGNSVSFLIQGLIIPFNSPLIIVLSLVILFLCASAFIVAARLISGLNSVARKLNKNKGPLDSWYLHYFKITYWGLVYIMIIPVMLPDVLPADFKKKAEIVYVVFNLLAYLFFLLRCENILQNNFRKSLLSKKHIYLTLKTSFTHAALTAAPILASVFIRIANNRS